MLWGGAGMWGGLIGVRLEPERLRRGRRPAGRTQKRTDTRRAKRAARALAAGAAVLASLPPIEGVRGKAVAVRRRQVKGAAGYWRGIGKARWPASCPGVCKASRPRLERAPTGCRGRARVCECAHRAARLAD